MTGTRVGADTDALRSYAERSAAMTMTARARTFYLDEVLWAMKRSSSGFLGHVPALEDEIREVLAAIERTDAEVRSVAVRFEATQQGILRSINAFGGFGIVPGRYVAGSAGFVAPFVDPATVVVATGEEEISLSAAVVVGLAGAGRFRWTEYADGHFEVVETVEGGGTIGAAVGADIGAWKSGFGAGASAEIAETSISEQTFIVGDEDELVTLIKHRALRRAQDAHETVNGLVASATPGGEAIGRFVGQAIPSVLPTFDDLVGYEPNRVGGSSGIRYEVTTTVSAEATLVEDTAGLAAQIDANVSYSDLRSENGTASRVIEIGGLGEGTLGVLGLRLGGTPLGVEGSAGGSVTVVSDVDADGSPTSVEIGVEIQTGDDMIVETVVYDLSDPDQRAEAAPVASLVGGDVGALSSSLGLVFGVAGGRPTTGSARSTRYRLARDTGSVGARVGGGAKIELRATHERERRQRVG